VLQFYDQLPVDFRYSDGLNMAQDMGISARRYKGILKIKGLFIKESRGKYTKANRLNLVDPKCTK